MAHWEHVALDRAPWKPLCCLRYIEDIFVIGSYGRGKLNPFLGILNNLYSSSQFTMEMERDNCLLGMHVCFGSLMGHRGEKRTHPDLSLNALSQYHRAQKTACFGHTDDTGRVSSNI